eukprot:GHVN01034987.1.p3 GENE.GHVN01034987.1~~GHVN01034987.1.p3  ORF type:complete len:360 (-),score=38.96 GHVN01034987.1:1457-2536(-)
MKRSLQWGPRTTWNASSFTTTIIKCKPLTPPQRFASTSYSAKTWVKVHNERLPIETLCNEMVRSTRSRYFNRKWFDRLEKTVAPKKRVQLVPYHLSLVLEAFARCGVMLSPNIERIVIISLKKFEDPILFEHLHPQQALELSRRLLRWMAITGVLTIPEVKFSVEALWRIVIRQLTLNPSMIDVIGAVAPTITLVEVVARLEAPHLELPKIPDQIDRLVTESVQKGTAAPRKPAPEVEDVHNVLHSLGVEYEKEVSLLKTPRLTAGISFYPVDVVVPQLNTVIELDGRHHYVIDTQTQRPHRKGEHVMKDRLLTAAGWTVLHIAFSEEWNRLSTFRGKQGFIMKKLSLASKIQQSGQIG